MPKLKTVHVCAECGHESSKWLGKCPGCNAWGSFYEEILDKAPTTPISSAIKKSVPEKLADIKTTADVRYKTHMSELDRVLNGGIVEGSLVLLSGSPGVGKSTLLLQICQSIGNQGLKVLYVSGEESAQQIKIRADRLKITTDNLLILPETNISVVESYIENISPNLIIIDSIQTMYRQEIASHPGSVSQIRESANSLIQIGKGLNIPVIIVGHVTKDGSIAGPRILEHMVDTVLYFEGDNKANYRIIRVEKNRFGSTNEIGVFEMRDIGLVEITNPSEYMLSGRPQNAPGSVVTCAIEGTRPILTEVQALTSYTNFGTPRRMATGVDYNRAVLLLAVLEKVCGLNLANYDSYINLAGGMKIAEPSLDAAILCAVASSYKNIPLSPDIMVFGEIGLTGEVRSVTNPEKRVQEAKKLGFKTCIAPRTSFKDLKKIDGIEILGINNVAELLNVTL